MVRYAHSSAPRWLSSGSFKWSSRLRRHTAVDDESASDDVARGGRGEEYHGGGDLVRLPCPPKRHCPDHPGASPSVHRPHHVRVDQPGRHEIDPDPPAGNLQGQSLGESGYTALAGAVVQLAGLTGEAADRADEH